MTSEYTRLTTSLTLKVKGTGVRGPKPTGEVRTGRSPSPHYTATQLAGLPPIQLPRHHLLGGGWGGLVSSGWCLSD